MKKADLTGKQFGYLEVLAQAESKHGMTRWLCKCHYQNCGNEVVVYAKNLKAGITKRCNAHAKNAGIGAFLIEEQADNNGLNPSMFSQKRRSSNTSGFKGVAKEKDRHGNTCYRAFLTVAGKTYRGRRFSTAEDAYQERVEMEKIYLPEFIKSKK